MRLSATWPALLRLAWPAVATGLVRISMRTIDLVVVGAVVGPVGVAAVGIADAAARLVLMVALGLSAGTVALVSQRTGAGDREGADAATTQTALLAVCIGGLATVAGFAGAPAFFRLLGASADVAAPGATYLRVVIASAAPRMLAVMLSRALQAAGDTRTPMVVRSAGTVVNIALTVVLVTGAGPLPRMGVTGAAVGTAVGNVLSGGALVWLLLRARLRVGVSRAGLRALATGREIVRIGAPQLAERTLHALADIPLNALVLVFGTTANAGYQVGRRMQLLALMPGLGIGIAGGALVGQSIGRDDLRAAERNGSGAALLATLSGAAAAAVLGAAAGPVAGVFAGGDPGAQAVMATWVRTFAAATVFRSLHVVLRGGMTAAGDTRRPLVASLVGIAAFLLGFSALTAVVLGAGIVGVQAGIVLDPAARAALLHRWWRAGHWRAAIVRRPAPAVGSHDRGEQGSHRP